MYKPMAGKLYLQFIIHELRLHRRKDHCAFMYIYIYTLTYIDDRLYIYIHSIHVYNRSLRMYKRKVRPARKNARRILSYGNRIDTIRAWHCMQWGCRRLTF